MKKIAIFISALLAVGAGGARAQQSGDLNRELEVVRAYTPTVREAEKLNIRPNMVDTVALRPDLNYRINANPINYGFDVRPIRPAMVDVNMYQYRSPLYVKAALGFPFQSLADAYFNSTGLTDGKFGIYANHYGSWSDIKNFNGHKSPAAETFNKFGALGEKRFGRYRLDGEIGFDYDKVSRYGFYTDGAPAGLTMDTTANGLKQHFSTIRAKVGFGDTFEDLSHFNWRVGVSGGRLGDHAYDLGQSFFKAGIDIGGQLRGIHELTLKTSYEASQGMKEYSPYKNFMVNVSPLYHLKSSQFEFALGLDYTLNRLMGETEHYFFPRFLLRLDIADGYFVPYIEAYGELQNNDFRHLAALNPYVQMLAAPNTAEYNGRIGFMGAFSSAFSYKLYGGISRLNNLVMFANDRSIAGLNGATFSYLTDSVTMWTLGVDLEGRISGSFGLEASVQYKGFSGGDEDHVSGVPNLTAKLGLVYRLRDRVTFRLGGTLLTNRHFAVIDWSKYTVLDPDAYKSFEKVGTTFDLSFGVEYKVSEKIGVFLQGNNLINQKLYPYYQYRGLGINGLAGVKVNF